MDNTRPLLPQIHRYNCIFVESLTVRDIAKIGLAMMNVTKNGFEKNILLPKDINKVVE